jgi:protein gp37
VKLTMPSRQTRPGRRARSAKSEEHQAHRCLAQDVPFFFKQWGGTTKRKPDVGSTVAFGINYRSGVFFFERRESEP